LNVVAILLMLSPETTKYITKVAAGLGPELLPADEAALGTAPQPPAVVEAGTMLQPDDGARAGVSDGATMLPVPSDPTAGPPAGRLESPSVTTPTPTASMTSIAMAASAPVRTLDPMTGCTRCTPDPGVRAANGSA
jgi:hypothetical protein